MKRYTILALISMLVVLLPTTILNADDSQPYNVLFISIDDLNDWIEPLGGHPDALTPNLQRLADRSVSFTRAYCPAPACNPSRTATMTGMAPYTSGVYNNNSVWRESPLLKDWDTIPQFMMKQGYYSMGAGKIFHTNFPDPESWQLFYPSLYVQRPLPPSLPTGTSLSGVNAQHFDWGAVDFALEDYTDRLVVDYVAKQLGKRFDKPLFLACGIYYPHLPWYLPQEYLDRFPLDEIQLPLVLEGDLDDLPPSGLDNIRIEDHERVIQNDQWKIAVQAYLGAIAFADDCLGIVLDALDNGPNADNTIIVLWSDHGWNLGEKNHWRKFALWENTTRVPLMFSGPGIPQGVTNGSPANLLDIYPTIADLLGFEIPAELDGKSLKPVLENPDLVLTEPSITVTKPGTYAVRTADWRYIRYTNGDEELYRHDTSHPDYDPHDWQNLASNPEYREIMDNLATYIPTEEAEVVPGFETRMTYYERVEWRRKLLEAEGFYDKPK